MKILIVTLSYFDDEIYTKFYETQNQTWDSLNVDGVENFYLVGDSDTDRLENKVIRTNVSESLTNCGHKTLKAFSLLKDYNYDFIFRTNSSSYIDKRLLKFYLQDKPKSNFYSGVVGNHYGISFSSGSGFAISKDLVNLVLENQDLWNHNYIDDVALGSLLSSKGISPIPAPRFDIDVSNDNIPLNFYHYRFKSFDRNLDCEKMKILHRKKIQHF